MKKFKFSLQKMMDFKQQRLNIIISELQNMYVELQNTDTMITQNNILYKEKGLELNECLEKGISKQEAIVYSVFLQSLLTKGKELEIRKRNIEKNIDQKKIEVKDAKNDIKALEKLREKQLTEYEKQSQKKFELLIEEFVSQKL